MLNIYKVIFVAFFVMLLPLVVFAEQAFHSVPLKIQNGEGGVEFKIELAADDRSRTKGLMFRRSLEENAGMLFVYERPQQISMWMKNTFVPLDMIFIGEDARIVSIHKDAVPQSLKVISSYVPAKYVLEVASGSVKRLNIKLGQKILHPVVQVK